MHPGSPEHKTEWAPQTKPARPERQEPPTPTVPTEKDETEVEVNQITATQQTETLPVNMKPACPVGHNQPWAPAIRRKKWDSGEREYNISQRLEPKKQPSEL